jgi:hypothetical protein
MFIHNPHHYMSEILPLLAGSTFFNRPMLFLNVFYGTLGGSKDPAGGSLKDE